MRTMTKCMLDVRVLGKVIGNADSVDFLEDVDGTGEVIQYYGFIANDLGRQMNLPIAVDFFTVNLELGTFASYSSEGDRTDLEVNLNALLEE